MSLVEVDQLKDPNRGTGRTTRMLQEVLANAKPGKKIVVVVRTFDFVDTAMRMLQTLHHRVFKRSRSTADYGDCRIEFWEMGNDLTSRWQGLPKDTLLFYDHDVQYSSVIKRTAQA